MLNIIKNIYNKIIVLVLQGNGVKITNILSLSSVQINKYYIIIKKYILTDFSKYYIFKLLTFHPEVNSTSDSLVHPRRTEGNR